MRPSGAPIASPTRCSHAGGKGSRTVSKCARAITASRKGFGIPSAVRLPVGGEREHRLEQRLELERGAVPRRRSARRLVACVTKRVRSPSRNQHTESPACASNNVERPSLQLEGAAQDFEAFVLARMHMAGGHEAMRLHEHTRRRPPRPLVLGSEVRRRRCARRWIGFSMVCPVRIMTSPSVWVSRCVQVHARSRRTSRHRPRLSFTLSARR